MTNLINFPTEIIEQILTGDIVEVKDVINVTLTCTHFRDLIQNNNTIWKFLYSKRWPQLMNSFVRPPVSWYAEMKFAYELLKRMHAILADMSPKFFKCADLSHSNLSPWRDLMSEHPLAYYYLVSELMRIVNNNSVIHGMNTVPINTPGNLTYRYYARKALRFIRQQHLTNQWESYVSLPTEQQTLEHGAVLLAQWFQPTIDVSLQDISTQLDNIANKCRDLLGTMYPNHSIFKKPIETQQKWRIQNLNTNQWNEKECLQIMEAMGIVLYIHLGFYGNNNQHIVPENLYINAVLKSRCGLSISLAIVYEGVARRLGIRSEPIYFSEHFFLRWVSGPDVDRDVHFIDAFNKGQFVLKGSCPHATAQSRDFRRRIPTCSAEQVMIRIASNLEQREQQIIESKGRATRLRSVLELLRLINPFDLSSILNLAKLYMLYDINVDELTTYLQNPPYDPSRQTQVQQIVNMLQDYAAHNKNARGTEYPQVEVTPRPSNLKFAIGMVMVDLIEGQACVICDWDPVCSGSLAWHKENRVSEQPFYNVITSYGLRCYLAQDLLSPNKNPESLLFNEDLGCYFSHYHETHFVPNAEKEKEYPEDAKVRQMYHEKLVFGLLDTGTT